MSSLNMLSNLSEINISGTAITFINQSLPDDLGLGPVRAPLSTAIPMTIVYTLILVTGVIGNLSTCIVIIRNRHMHTATNYYLFSLAVSDLLLLILGLPQEMYQIWQKYPYAFGEYFCVIRGLTSETSTNASVLTITAFTVERYLAICHPLKAHTMSKLSRVVKLIIIIWIFGAMCAAPLAYQFGIVFDYHNDIKIPQSAACTVKRTIPFVKEHAFTISSFLVFVIPVTIISVLYMLIGIQLRRSDQLNRRREHSEHTGLCMTGHGVKGNTLNGNTQIKRNGSLHGKHMRRSIEGKPSLNLSNNLSQRRAVIKMLIAVVVAFFICFAPFHAQRLMAIYVNDPTPAEILAYTVLMYISGVTYYVSATINPILYSIMSLKFRQAFKETLGRCGRRSESNRFGKFMGSASSYAQVRINSIPRSSLSNTDFSIVSDSNIYNLSNFKAMSVKEKIPSFESPSYINSRPSICSTSSNVQITDNNNANPTHNRCNKNRCNSIISNDSIQTIDVHPSEGVHLLKDQSLRFHGKHSDG